MEYQKKRTRAEIKEILCIIEFNVSNGLFEAVWQHAHKRLSQGTCQTKKPGTII